jgi:hypothetical protein
MTDLDGRLGAALQSLADDQPPAPQLFDAVVARRARRRRTRLRTGFVVTAGAAAAAVVVALAGPGVLATLHPDPGVPVVGTRTADGRFEPTSDAGWLALCDGTQHPLPADLPGPLTVVRCREETQAVAGDATWRVRLVERADGDPSPLLALLRRDPPAGGGGCPFVLILRPTITVVDTAGRAWTAQWPDPAGGCPYAVGAAVPEQDVAGFTPVAEQRLSRVRTPAEVDADRAGR